MRPRLPETYARVRAPAPAAAIASASGATSSGTASMQASAEARSRSRRSGSPSRRRSASAKPAPVAVASDSPGSSGPKSDSAVVTTTAPFSTAGTSSHSRCQGLGREAARRARRGRRASRASRARRDARPVGRPCCGRCGDRRRTDRARFASGRSDPRGRASSGRARRARCRGPRLRRRGAADALRAGDGRWRRRAPRGSAWRRARGSGTPDAARWKGRSAPSAPDPSRLVETQTAPRSTSAMRSGSPVERPERRMRGDDHLGRVRARARATSVAVTLSPASRRQSAQASEHIANARVGVARDDHLDRRSHRRSMARPFSARQRDARSDLGCARVGAAASSRQSATTEPATSSQLIPRWGVGRGRVSACRMPSAIALGVLGSKYVASSPAISRSAGRSEQTTRVPAASASPTGQAEALPEARQHERLGVRVEIAQLAVVDRARTSRRPRRRRRGRRPSRRRPRARGARAARPCGPA